MFRDSRSNATYSKVAVLLENTPLDNVSDTVLPEIHNRFVDNSFSGDISIFYLADEAGRFRRFEGTEDW